jgi:hypothetical protein
MFGKSASCGLLLGLLLGGPASAFLPLPSSGRRLLQRPELKVTTSHSALFVVICDIPQSIQQGRTDIYGCLGGCLLDMLKRILFLLACLCAYVTVMPL